MGSNAWFYPLPVLIVDSYDENGKINPAKLQAISFDLVNNAYLKFGEKVRNAFGDRVTLK